MAHADSVGRAISELIDQEKWDAARRRIQAALAKDPGNHWLLDRLGLTYYEQLRYPDALCALQCAYERKPRCPLVLWDLAGTLDALGSPAEALRIYRGLRHRGVDSIAHDECGEGVRWAKSLLADCAFRIGACYQHLHQNQLAVNWFSRYIEEAKRCSASIYTELNHRARFRSIPTRRVSEGVGESLADASG